jgi:enterobactin synthetase component D
MQMRASVLALFPSGVAGAELVDLDAAGPLHPVERSAVAHAAPRRVREFAAGRHCAREALQQLGLPAGALPRGADRAPRWPDGAVGSIAHCEGYCGAVVGRRVALAGLGLDVERRGRVAERLLRRIATEAERAEIEALPEAERRERATLLFAAKEAFYKAQQPAARATLGFRDAAVRVLDGERFELVLARDVAAAGPAGTRFPGRYRLEGPHVFAALAIAARRFTCPRSRG